MQFIKAAELFADRDDLLFLIFGDGPDRILLEDYCKKHNLRNIKFKDKWIDPKLVPYVVSQSYINILNYVSSDFAKYGISSSKMFQYFAAGKPILCNINILYCPITANNIGIARELTTPESYAAAIDCLLSLSSDEYNAMCERVYNTAKEYDYEYLTNKFIGIIKKLEQ